MLTSRPPLVFQENSENFKEERNVKRDILEAQWHVAIVGEGFEKTLQDLQRHFSLLAPTFIIVTDYKEEKQIENKIIEAEVDQPIEVEQSTNFLWKPIEGKLFNVELDSLDIPIDVPTKVRSKCMMRHKGKE